MTSYASRSLSLFYILGVVLTTSTDDMLRVSIATSRRPSPRIVMISYASVSLTLFYILGVVLTTSTDDLRVSILRYVSRIAVTSMSASFAACYFMVPIANDA